MGLVYVLSMPSANPLNDAEVQATLSAPRMSTYLAEAQGDARRALALYGWNARISSALMLPTHFVEVATRNAVSDALTNVYGPGWPWNSAFRGSLPSPSRGYNPRRNLEAECQRQPTEGKIIAELKFVFWQNMFTTRHDGRVWNNEVMVRFPNSNEPTPATLRSRIYHDLEVIRRLRNRLAHHEPIFARNLTDDLCTLLDLVSLRSTETANWVKAMECVSTLIPQKP